ncbi:MAG TPA: protein kinase, partial [Vicinamibacteria bacterium]
PAPREVSPALDLTSDPPGALVFVDDEPVGRTDPQTGRLRLTALSPGRHRIRLSAEGRLDLIRELDLSSEGAKLEGVLPNLPTDSPAASEERSALAPPLPPGAVWALGLGVTVLALGLWARSLVRRPAWSRELGTPSRGRSGGGEAGTDEVFPRPFDDFVLVRRIGKGGMAAVYEATRDGERFALKRPLTGFLDDPHFLERFLREAELGRTLHHPNIVRIFERGQVGNTPYFVMELVLGETLRACLDREGALDPPRAVRLIEQVAEALDYAHSKGVIHRDLKPSNIMLETQDRVKVMDYGIARAQRLEGLTTTGAFLGTPYYAAPETVEGGAEPRSDLYSLGVVFFEMLTGSLPFRGDTSFVVMRNHCTTPPPVPSSLKYTLSAELDRIVLRLLSKAPKDRPTAEELLNELRDSIGEDR